MHHLDLCAHAFLEDEQLQDIPRMVVAGDFNAITTELTPIVSDSFLCLCDAVALPEGTCTYASNRYASKLMHVHP